MKNSLPSLWNPTSSSGGDWAFASPRPRVRLVKSFQSPFNNIIATARTCYSGKGIVEDEDVLSDRWRELAQDLYLAGHHTTFQHAHFQFAIENVSRQFIWSFLHSHPFYNSEQVSQRYVPVKAGQYAIPPLNPACERIYLETADAQMEAYRTLTDLLKPIVGAEYYSRYRLQGQGTERHQRNVGRKAMEIARYVLPVAVFSYLYHTVSGITLLRYARTCSQMDVPVEQREVALQMALELVRFDEGYLSVIQEPLAPDAYPEAAYLGMIDSASCARSRAFTEEFDSRMRGEFSTLCGWSAQDETVLADSVRQVIGRASSEMSDAEAIELALSPEKNPLLGESLNLTTHAKITRALFHPRYAFQKRISHTADSQDQRHRMTPGSRPILAAQYTGEPDYITPEILRKNGECLEIYDRAMRRAWEGMNALLQEGVAAEHALYLLPNAFPIRFTESADLLNLRHKHAMRLCYNAQEEIWKASVEEATQIREVHPRIGECLQPPCGHRKQAQIKPFCPEGERYCGIPVWKLDLKDYRRLI